MARFETTVTMKGIYSYEAPAYGYGYETRYIYNMVGEDGTVYVWKTTAFMCEQIPETDEREIRLGRKWNYSKINKGDMIQIKATVKGQSEYKGQPQTEITRVTVVKRLTKAKTWEEIQAEREAEKAAKKQEQINSLVGEDFIWRMPYKQYKEHYNDCETVIGSYEKFDRAPGTIEVIIREGRLKASGVRGQHYSGYEFFVIDETGRKYRTCYRAVCEGNALRRCEKDFPNAVEIVPGKIYQYGA